MSVPNSPAFATKRVTMPLNDGLNNLASSVGAVQDWLTRHLVMLPVTTTRWRYKVRDWSNLTESAGSAAGPVTASGIYIGTPSFPSGTGRWTGTFSPAPTLALPSGLVVVTGADVVSGWVTDPTLQFQAGQEYGVSVGFTGNASTAFLYASTSGWYFGAAGAAAAAGNATIPGGGALLSTLDQRIEYETSMAPGKLVTLCIGDSITSGIPGEGTASGVHESWPGALALRLGMPVINLGVGSTTSSNWANTAQAKYTRADLATTVPDQAIVALGVNDVAFGGAAATTLTAILAAVDTVRSLGIPRVFVATIAPDNLSGATETARLAVNDAIRQGLPRVAGVVDFDAALRVPSAQATADPQWIGTYPHPRRAGYQLMAAVAATALR